MVTNPSQTVIIGRALVSSLGLDATTCCAAARAGIVRTCDAEHYLAGNDELAAGSPVTVHRAPMTHGFEGAVRLQVLVAAALEDLRLQLPAAPWRDATTGVYLAMPAPDRESQGAPLIIDEQERERFIRSNQGRGASDLRRRAEEVLARARELAGFEKPLGLRVVDDSGSTGVTRAAIAADEDLRRGHVELALVIGVDSLVEERTLHWLDRGGRLKTSVRPAGLRAGEACAILALETRARAAQRRDRACAVFAAAACAHEADAIWTGRAATGATLAHTIDPLRRVAGWDQRAPLLTLDLNGENARALEWGNALTHLLGLCETYRDLRMEIPAIAFGDTGAASGGVAACMVLHAFERGYAAEPSVAIVNASDAGPRSAWLLAAPGLGS